MPKLPNRVVIGPLAYRITRDPKFMTSLRDSPALLGEANHVGATISLARDATGNLSTLLMHEILHAIWFCVGIPARSDLSEEDFVGLLAAPLVSFIQDNPQVIDFITRDDPHAH